jgi:hypothetical protein
MGTVTYDTWLQLGKFYKEQAEQYNQWAAEAKRNLLNNIGPIVAQKNDYRLETEYGKLIAYLALPWKPSANHLDKIENDLANTVTNEVIYEGLLVDLGLASHFKLIEDESAQKKD